MNESGVSLERMETLKERHSEIHSCVKLFLLIATDILGGSEQTCMTVLAICPLSFSPFLAAIR